MADFFDALERKAYRDDIRPAGVLRRHRGRRRADQPVAQGAVRYVPGAVADRVAYLDLGGSGNETNAHLLADGRITLMFCNFQQPALILRIYGTGQPVLPWERGWDEIAAHFTLLPGTRQIFDIAVESVQTSCGWGVPVMDFEHQRADLAQVSRAGRSRRMGGQVQAAAREHRRPADAADRSLYRGQGGGQRLLMRLTFASYNIHKAVGLDGRRDPDRIIAVLRELDADIIALQEADRRFGERETALPRALLDDTHWKVVPVARTAAQPGLARQCAAGAARDRDSAVRAARPAHARAARRDLRRSRDRGQGDPRPRHASRPVGPPAQRPDPRDAAPLPAAPMRRR